MTVQSTYWQTTKNVIWLSLGLGCVFGSFIFWILQLAPNTVEVVEEKQKEISRPITNEKVTISDSLGAFTKAVKPIDLSQRSVEVTVHDREFRGVKYVIDNQKKWTVQLMKISEEEIIKTYLVQRKDRNQFKYLRLQDGKNPDYYVLIYGIYDSEQQALENAQRVSFKLPSSITVLPKQIASYTPFVNDMGSDELMTSSKLREINLVKTYTPPSVTVAKPESTTEKLSTTPQIVQNNPALKVPNPSEKIGKAPTSVQKIEHDESPKSSINKNRENNTQISDPF